MMRLSDIREYIAGLGIADNEHVYIGKMDNKKEKSIGVYSRSRESDPVVALGGVEYSSYDVKSISLLVHWNRSKVETEEAALQLFEIIKKERRFVVGSAPVQFIRLMMPEPQDVGTDDDGIYEYVIWLDFIYQKEV